MFILIGIGWLVLLIFLAVAMMIWVRKKFGKDVLRQNHEVAGFVYAVIGSIFAVNIALVVDTVHDEFILAEKQAAHEAAQVSATYRLAEWFDNGGTMQKQLKEYTRLVISEEWPRMVRSWERGSPKASNQILRMVAAAKNFTIDTPNRQVAYAELLQRLSELQDARKERIYGEQANIPLGLVIVVLCGSFIIIGFSFFFAMDNHRMQIVIVSLVSILVWGNIMLVFSVRYPFNGIFSIPPNAFIDVLKSM